jgi:hypothetical protein
MSRDTLLDETIAWPREQWQTGAAWRLGHGLTSVGPGWHALVRDAFAAVAETPGATVVTVRQKCGILEVHVHHEDSTVYRQLQSRIDAITDASRRQCEGCGSTMPETPPGVSLWRKHCAECTQIVSQGGPRRERHLSETHSGRRWPASELW